MAGRPIRRGDGPAPRRPDVSYVPTPQKVVDRMLELTQVAQDDVVCDLGCGDRRIVITAAKQYGCRAVGYDIVDWVIDMARENVAQAGVKPDRIVTVEDAESPYDDHTVFLWTTPLNKEVPSGEVSGVAPR